MTNITELLVKEMLECSTQWDKIGESTSSRAFLERIYQMYLKRTWNEAVQSCNSIIQISTEQSNSSMRAGAHFYQGLIWHDWQKWQDAKKAYDRASDLFWLLGNPSRHEYALTKWALAALKESTNDYEGALYDYIEVATVFRLLRWQSLAQEKPVIAHHYREMLKKLEKSIEHVQDISNFKSPFAYTFPIVTKIQPNRDAFDLIIYYRENHRFTIHGKPAKEARPTSPDSSWMDPSWIDFDLQLDRYVDYYAIKAEPSMVGTAGIHEGDYLLVCLVKDNQLPRRKDNPKALGIFQDRDGRYQLVPKVIGGSHSDLYAYVDVILKEQS
jgi:tetratricopeptide (TPR) repeat protein